MARSHKARLRQRGPITPHIIQYGHPGRIDAGPVLADNVARLARAFPRARYRARKQPMADLFAAVEERSCALHELHHSGHRLVPLLIDIGARAAHWLRPIDDWRPRSSAPTEQISQLVRHLFQGYPTPAPFDEVWWPGRGRRRDPVAFGWYVHLATGHSIRTAPGLPTRMTRRAAHLLAEAPEHLDPLRALRWAQVRALGADPVLTDRLTNGPWSTSFAQDDVLLPLFEKMARATDFAVDDVVVVMAYVRHRLSLADGSQRFRIHKQSLASLVSRGRRFRADRQARVVARAHFGRWHHDPYVLLRTATWPGLDGASGSTETTADGQWTVAEIRDLSRLVTEGETMRHCVISYRQQCLAGTASIWSLHRAAGGTIHDRVTIRVQPEFRRVVEARGPANRSISRRSFEVLSRWAARNRLTMDSIPVVDEP